MNEGSSVLIDEELLQMILESARRLSPKETILVLRGKRKKGAVTVSDLVVPPLAAHGHSFATIPIHMLPIDFSVIGTAHSHPSGNLTPSSADLNHFFGNVLMIVGFPFKGEKNVAVYNRNGEKLNLQVTKT
jgi:proteasome lid subunit RPN8/RPN11